MSEKPIKYKKNYLTNVIFRIDYEPIPEMSKGLSSALRDIIEDSFPNSKEGEDISQTINMVDRIF